MLYAPLVYASNASRRRHPGGHHPRSSSTYVGFFRVAANCTAAVFVVTTAVASDTAAASCNGAQIQAKNVMEEGSMKSMRIGCPHETADRTTVRHQVQTGHYAVYSMFSVALPLCCLSHPDCIGCPLGRVQAPMRRETAPQPDRPSPNCQSHRSFVLLQLFCLAWSQPTSF